MNDQSVNLTLTAEGIDSYCRELARRLPGEEKRIAAVDALRTFLAVQVGTAVQSTPGYAAIRACLERHFEEARSALQHRQLGQLVDGLRARQLARARELYQALSRDAFWQLLLQAQHELGMETSEAVGGWSRAWLRDVERRSAQHSPYPDAIDFRAVGVDVADYSVMRDIARCFTAGSV